LAEVLITLAIIGVVAAITIPSIVANHQKRTLETQFVKVYRTLNQVMQLAQAEHGDFSTWDWKDSYSDSERDEFVKKYITPYLNVAKFCPTDNSGDWCFDPNANYKTFIGTALVNPDTVQDRPSVLLQDGTSFIITMRDNCLSVYNDRCLGIDIDINGAKKPNTWGRDMFAFNLYPHTGEFLPNGINKSKYDENTKSYGKNSIEEIDRLCTTSSGWVCTAKVVLEGFKMNYY